MITVVTILILITTDTTDNNTTADNNKGGLIDYGHHANNAFRAFNETTMFSDTIEMTMNMINKSDTLVVVTGDHGSSMGMASYPKLDGDILGVYSYIYFIFIYILRNRWKIYCFTLFIIP